MKNLIDQPQNAPFYDSVAELDIKQLEDLGDKVIRDFRLAIKNLENSTTKDKDFLKQAQAVELGLNQEGEALSIMGMVHPKKEFRDFSSEFSVKLSAEINSYNLNRNIYEKYRDNVNPDSLDKESLYLYEQTMGQYKRSGLDQTKEKRDKIKEMMDEMSSLANKFSRNINENTVEFKCEKHELEGCFKEFIESNTQKDGTIKISLVSSTILQILHNCKVKKTRETVRELSLSSCKESNWDVLPSFLNKAEQLAKLIGFNNYAELSMEDKMIENPKKAAEFIQSLLDSTKDRVDLEVQMIKDFKLKSKDQTDLTYADIDYYGNQIASELSKLDEEKLKEYFPYSHVKESILRIFEQMFDIKFNKKPAAKTWHKDVEVFDIVKLGSTIGIIYLDMHPRKGKYNHACSIDVIPGVKDLTVPQNILICNFNKPEGNRPGLQSLEEVTTFFHEFGHLLHSVLGGQKINWANLAGTRVQIDFAEAPSQLLEEIVMDPKVLKKLTKHIVSGSQITDELIHAIKNKESIFDKAKLKGIGIARQAALARQSLEVFTTENITNEKLTEIEHSSSKEALRVYGDYYCLYEFGHLTDYASNYYTYMWSLAISKDLFTKFNMEDLLDTTVAEHYRKTILEPGGSRPAAELVKDFLGREWSMDAFRTYLTEGEDLLERI